MSNKERATKLRAEIKRSRLVFSKKVVEELLTLTVDFAYSTFYLLGRDEYKELMADAKTEPRQVEIYLLFLPIFMIRRWFQKVYILRLCKTGWETVSKSIQNSF